VSSVAIERIEYRGWPNCYRVSNGTVEAIVTSDVGPRIIHFGFSGGRNFFKEFDQELGKSGEDSWQPRGGHRLWAAPEDRVKTYALDNVAVGVTIDRSVLLATAPVEPLTGIEKQIALKMASEGCGVEVVHRIRNAGSQPVTLAPWALTMLAQGGVGIHGLPPRGSHADNLSPSHPLVMWPYTNLLDPRWILLERYICLRQDPSIAQSQKMGSFHPWTWGAFLLRDELFVKQCHAPGGPADYTDYGSSFEIFANPDILELETLGPLTTLQPGDSVTHTERWSAYRGIHIEEWSDAELDRVIAPLVSGESEH